MADPIRIVPGPPRCPATTMGAGKTEYVPSKSEYRSPVFGRTSGCSISPCCARNLFRKLGGKNEAEHCPLVGGGPNFAGLPHKLDGVRLSLTSLERVGSDFGETWLRSSRFLLLLDQPWVDFGKTWHELDQAWADSVQVFAKIGHIGQSATKLGRRPQFSPRVAMFEHCSTKFAQGSAWGVGG